jgi:hypothetical protein
MYAGHRLTEFVEDATVRPLIEQHKVVPPAGPALAVVECRPLV